MKLRKLFQPSPLLTLFASVALNGAEFTPLFDGKSLKGWQYIGEQKEGYYVENGILICPASENGNLFTDREYANFVLRFEFRLEEGGNNGVAIRSPLRKDAHLSGMEIQILDDAAPRYRDVIKPVQYHGSIYGVIAARRGFLKRPGEWNQQEIMANGPQIKVTLNGTVIVDADLRSVKDPEILREHPGLQRTKGYIGFLGHSSRLEFRNITIEELL
jgi:hypothetical protein